MTKRQPRKVPLGKPLPPVPDDIELVSFADIDRARIVASKLGDDIFNAMLNATNADDEDFVANA